MRLLSLSTLVSIALQKLLWKRDLRHLFPYLRITKRIEFIEIIPISIPRPTLTKRQVSNGSTKSTIFNRFIEHALLHDDTTYITNYSHCKSQREISAHLQNWHANVFEVSPRNEKLSPRHILMMEINVEILLQIASHMQNDCHYHVC